MTENMNQVEIRRGNGISRWLISVEELSLWRTCCWLKWFWSVFVRVRRAVGLELEGNEFL